MAEAYYLEKKRGQFPKGQTLVPTTLIRMKTESQASRDITPFAHLVLIDHRLKKGVRTHMYLHGHYLLIFSSKDNPIHSHMNVKAVTFTVKCISSLTAGNNVNRKKA